MALKYGYDSIQMSSRREFIYCNDKCATTRVYSSCPPIELRKIDMDHHDDDNDHHHENNDHHHDNNDHDHDDRVRKSRRIISNVTCHCSNTNPYMNCDDNDRVDNDRVDNDKGYYNDRVDNDRVDNDRVDNDKG